MGATPRGRQPRMMTVKSKRIGMITPSSNTVVEPVTMAMTAALYPRVTTHYTRIEVKSISPEQDSLSQFDLDPMRRAAAMLADVGMDAIAWNGTSSAWRGFEDDQRLCDAITRETGTPAITSTLAQFEAFKAFGVRNYALAVPYLESVTRAIVPTYARAGFQGVSYDWLGISTNWQFAYVPDEDIRNLV